MFLTSWVALHLLLQQYLWQVSECWHTTGAECSLGSSHDVHWQLNVLQTVVQECATITILCITTVCEEHQCRVYGATRTIAMCKCTMHWYYLSYFESPLVTDWKHISCILLFFCKAKATNGQCYTYTHQLLLFTLSESLKQENISPTKFGSRSW